MATSVLWTPQQVRSLLQRLIIIQRYDHDGLVASTGDDDLFAVVRDGGEDLGTPYCNHKFPHAPLAVLGARIRDARDGF
jgi:hypothetical protein